MSKGEVPTLPDIGPEGDGGGVPAPCYLYLMATTTCTVGKRAVRILLECFLEGSEHPLSLYQVSFRKQRR